MKHISIISRNFRKVACIFSTFSLLMLSANNTLAFDANKAAKTFKKCAACHQIGEGAENKLGPHLNGIKGRVAGTIEGAKYSNSLKRAGHDGLEWNAETLDQYLKKPRSFIKGTRMSFSGLRKKTDRANLVEWLISFSADGKSIAGAEAGKEPVVLLGASAAALQGDPEYGEYLSGECVTCHQLSGENDGIPSITGWPKEEFIHALYEYKTDVRENPVMRTASKRLGDEEMAALAAFFETVEN